MILLSFSDFLWSVLFFPLFLYCSLVSFPALMQLCKRFGKQREAKRISSGKMHGFQAAATCLAATVGTGNIIGTAQAISMGGPGAVFWIWAAAILGCSIKCAEIRHGQTNNRGAVGTVESALGKHAACLYALFAALSALFVGNMAQMNTVISAISQTSGLGPRFQRLFLGLLLILLLALVLESGLTAVGKACSFLVPCMTILYLSCTFYILSANRSMIFPAFREILQDALRPRAAFGAACGLCTRNTVLWGLRRGIFSNEAGLGTSGTVHALVHCDDPDRHALWGLLEVGVDTLLLCTVSALTLLCSGVKMQQGILPDAELWVQIYSLFFPPFWGKSLLTLCLCTFALSTVIGCYVPGSLCALRIGIGEKQYRWIFLLCGFMGCFLSTDLIWRCADVLNVLMACPNLLSLILLERKKNVECERDKNNHKNRESSLAPERRKV